MKPPSPVSPHDVSATPSGLDAAARAARANANWDDWKDEELPVRRLSATEAEAYRDQRRAPSPWRVVLVQAETGAVIALLIGLMFGWSAALSALYGAATAIIPGALMARGATRLAGSRSVMATTLGLLGWESVKILCSMAMLVSAARVLHPVVWLALLVTLTGCLGVYWVALAWRSR